MSHRSLIREVACEIGTFHLPRVYQAEVLKRYGVRVSSSSVVKSLGAYKRRKFVDAGVAESKAAILLSFCCGDLFQAKHLLDRVATR